MNFPPVPFITDSVRYCPDCGEPLTWARVPFGYAADCLRCLNTWLWQHGSMTLERNVWERATGAVA